MKALHQKKAEIQLKAKALYKEYNSSATLCMATGTGKSKIGVDEAVETFQEKSDANVLIVVPTTKLKEKNWPNEFKDWGHDYLIPLVKRACYKSINKIENEVFDLVIFDESHHITENNSVFLENNVIKKKLSLTATPPVDREKKVLFYKYFPVAFEYTLAQAMEDGIISPYSIKVIETCLSHENNILVETRNKKFKTSEIKQYEYLSSKVEEIKINENKRKQEFLKTRACLINDVSLDDEKKEMEICLLDANNEKEIKKYEGAFKMAILKRMHFIYGCSGKTSIAKKIKERHLDGTRHLMFCSNIRQAEELSKHTFHSESKNDQHYTDFCNKKINELASVRALNEGENIADIDQILVTQMNSKGLMLIQQVGRAIRLRERHRAVVWVIVISGTVDEDWARESLSQHDPSIIEYLTDEDL